MVLISSKQVLLPVSHQSVVFLPSVAEEAIFTSILPTTPFHISIQFVLDGLRPDPVELLTNVF